MNTSLIESMITGSDHSMFDLCAIVPEIRQLLVRNKPVSYESFVAQIDLDLNNIISNTESGRTHHLDKGEDAITEHIIAQMKQLYPSVHHDAQNGGHCDIYIEVKGSNGQLYKWIMEAKLWNGFKYVYAGLKSQLLDSYAIGGENSNNGGMIFYSKGSLGAHHFFDVWYRGLKEKDDIVVGNKSSDGLRLKTKHILNDGSGADFYVNHYCVDLYHQPTQLKLEKVRAK